MPKVTFAYNIHKDAWSWVIIAKNKDIFGMSWKQNNSHIPKNLLNQIQKVNFSQAVNLVEKHLKTDPKKTTKEKSIKEQLDKLEKAWKPVAKKYFNTLSNTTNKPICAQKFSCFMTTGFMCPYDEKEYWFMASLQHSIPFSITTICHEIMHFQFLYHYKSYLKKKGLSNKQIEILKEALTFLLNEPEFKQVISSEDTGYPEHQELRKKLKNIWTKSKNFQKLLDKAVLEVSKRTPKKPII